MLNLTFDRKSARILPVSIALAGWFVKVPKFKCWILDKGAMFVKLCSPLLLFFFPGYVTLRALRVKGLGWSEVLFLSAFSSILLSSWLGLLLAELALFSLWPLLLLLLVYSLGMAVAFKVRPTWGNIPRPWLDIGLSLIHI